MPGSGQSLSAGDVWWFALLSLPWLALGALSGLLWFTGVWIPDAPSTIVFSSLAVMFFYLFALMIALFATPAALATGVVLVSIRMVAGTVGSPLSRLDVIVVAGLGAFAALDPVLWPAGLAALAWLVRAPEVGPLRTWGTAAFGVGATAGLGLLWYQWSSGSIEPVDVTTTAYVLAGAAGVAMLFAARPLAVTSRTDSDSSVIAWTRVRSARIATGAICMWAAVIGGIDGFWSIGPVFAALAVAATFRVFVQPAAKPS